MQLKMAEVQFPIRASFGKFGLNFPDKFCYDIVDQFRFGTRKVSGGRDESEARYFGQMNRIGERGISRENVISGEPALMPGNTKSG